MRGGYQAFAYEALATCSLVQEFKQSQIHSPIHVVNLAHISFIRVVGGHLPTSQLEGLCILHGYFGQSPANLVLKLLMRAFHAGLQFRRTAISDTSHLRGLWEQNPNYLLDSSSSSMPICTLHWRVDTIAGL